MQKICTSYSDACRKLGGDIARVLYRRLLELRSAETVDDLIKNHIGRCHALTGNRAQQYAMDLGHPYRLIFTVEQTETAFVIEITDYH